MKHPSEKAVYLHERFLFKVYFNVGQFAVLTLLKKSKVMVQWDNERGFGKAHSLNV